MFYFFSGLETRFFSYIQLRKLQTVEIGEIGPELGLTPVQERKLLSRLSRRGLITRVRRGLYLVPPTIPPGGKWSPGQALALSTLMEDKKGQYQLCGPNAFYRYRWTEQVPNRLYVYNNRLSGDRKIGPVTLTLIKVDDKRLGSLEAVTTSEGIVLNYSSKARALMDAVYDWSRFNSLPRAYEWIAREIDADDAMLADLVDVCISYGNQGTIRRVGKLLSMKAVNKLLLRKLAKRINQSSSLIPWVPSKPKKGQIDKRWGVILNNG